MKRKSDWNFQNIGTLLALVVSVVALVVSIQETNLMAEQQRATVWPYLDLDRNYNGEGFMIDANNNGTGPAIIKSMEVTVDGEPVADYLDLVQQLLPGSNIGYERLRVGRLNKHVLRAGAERFMFEVGWDDETRALVDEFNRVNVVINYCSVLDECWVYDLAKDERKPGLFKARLEFGN